MLKLAHTGMRIILFLERHSCKQELVLHSEQFQLHYNIDLDVGKLPSQSSTIQFQVAKN